MKRSVEIILATMAIAAGALLPLTTEAQSPTDGVVKIGVLTDMSGQFSDESGEGAVTAVKMAVEDFGGKVLGKPIEIVVADHQNSTDVAVAKAREWYDHGVNMITDLIVSPIALAVSNLAKEKNRIAIVNGAGTSALTNEACNPNTVHYSYDTYALANGAVHALIANGLKTWYFLTVDYALGKSLQTDATTIIQNLGGEVVGSVRYPISTNDFSSFVLRAQGSKASVVAVAGSGTTFINGIKATHEFGLNKKQTIAGLLVWINDVNALSLDVAQGMQFATAFYWDRTPASRAWSKRFFERMHKMPNQGQAGDYSATLHYLKAVQAAGTDDATAVMKEMEATPVNDFFATNGRIRADGRMVHDMYVYQVKKPSESHYPWDYYKPISTIPGNVAFRSLAESKCPLINKS